MTDSLNPPGKTRLAAPRSDKRRVAFELDVVAGPDTGSSIRVIDVPQLVGTSPVCDLRVTDDHVSRRHMSVVQEGEHLAVRDLGSSNGTSVNGLGIVHARLVGAEHIQVGRTVLLARAVLEEPAAAVVRSHFGSVVGVSPAMQRVYDTAERLAKSDVPIVIEGETGTGKEQLAEAIHEVSARAKGPFVVFDCTAVAESLLESALFGHERGAFTGAIQQRPGVFEQADGGTLFIDEIGDLDVTLQPKLLRAIQHGSVQRVGGMGWTKTDVRIIAATRRNLDDLVQQQRFRDDLFYRLAVGRIELPALRDCEADAMLLANLFWGRLSRGAQAIPAEFLEKMRGYSFPGNVRELENLVARRFALGESAQESLRMVARAATSASGFDIGALVEADLPYVQAKDSVIAWFDREYVQIMLAKHQGNVSRAAEAAGIGRRYLHTIMARVKG